jgi:SAM-dependent methyltransferase
LLSDWTPEKLEWYVRASRYTGFHRSIAERIVPFLKPDDKVVDFGCGPGLLAVELAGAAAHIHAIDINPAPIAFLKTEADRIGVSNISAAVTDAKDFRGEFDVGLFCYFEGENLMPEMLGSAGRLTALVMHGDRKRPVQTIASAQLAPHRAFASEMREILDEAGFVYTLTEEAHNFGQPLRSREEAEAFFAAYTASGGTISCFSVRDEIERKIAALKKTKDADYPYLYPHTRDAAVFIIKNNTGI